MVAAALLSVAAPPKARAANVFWDVNGTTAGVGGTGNWDTTTANWFNAGSGNTITGMGTTAAYTFTSADTAFINSGPLTLGAGFGVTVGGLVFGFKLLDPSAKGGSVSGGTITLDAGLDGNSLPISPVIATHAGRYLGPVTINTTVINSVLVATNGFTKSGGGSLILTAANPGIAGTIIINDGILEVGAVATSLGSATVRLNTGTTLSLISPAGLIITNNLVIAGASTLNTGSTVTSAGIARGTSGTVSLANTTLNFNNANRAGATNTTGDDPVINGTLTLLGLQSTLFNSQTIGNIDPVINGKITGPGALTIAGGSGGINFFGAGNDYTGGTYLYKSWSGAGTSTVFGTGPIVFGAGQTPFFRAPANIAGASSFSVLSSLYNVTHYAQHSVSGVAAAGMGGIGGLFLPNVFAMGSTLGATMTGPYGSTLQVFNGLNWTNAIDMALVGSHAAGNAPWFLGAVNASSTYSADTLGADGNVYRLGAGNTQLTVTKSVLNSASASLVVGNPLTRAMVWGAGVQSGIIVLDAVQTYGGSTTVNRQSQLLVTNGTLQNILPATSLLNISGLLQVSGSYTGTGPQLSNPTINVFNTGYAVTAGNATGLVLGGNSLAVTSNNLRLADTTRLNLNSGNLRMTGSLTAAAFISQTFGSIYVQGGNLIAVEQGAVAVNNAVVTATDLVRQFAGTVTLMGLTTDLGSNAKFIVTKLNGSALTATNGMVAPWIINHFNPVSPTFVTTGANGLVPVAYTAAGTPAALQAAAATAIVDVTAAAALTGNASVQALRVGNFSITGAFNITVGSIAAAGEAAGVIFGSTSVQFNTNNWIFGTAGAREALVYASTSGQTTLLSGTVNATGLTKTGNGKLTLAGFNTGTATTSLLSGNITVNQGILTAAFPVSVGSRPNPSAPYSYDTAALTLAGGTFDTSGIVLGTYVGTAGSANVTVANTAGLLAPGVMNINGPNINGGTTIAAVTSSTALTLNQNVANAGSGTAYAIALQGNMNFLNNVTVLNDSTLTTHGWDYRPRFGSLTFAARLGGATDPTMLTINNGHVFTGATTLTQNAWMNVASNSLMLEGAVGGAGTLDKFGGGNVALFSGSNTMSGAITVHVGILASITNRAGATTALAATTDTPFGTSTITVNPGAGLHLSNSNVGGGLTLNSDQTGLAIVGLGYVGAAPSFTANYTNTGSPYSAVIAIDAVGYNLNIDQSTLGGGKTFLGGLSLNSNDGSGISRHSSGNFTGTITPGTTTAAGSGYGTAPAGSTYRLGGGSGLLNLNRTNVLTGANNAVFGAVTTAVQASSTTMLGGGGTVVLNTANNYSGFSTFNAGQTVQVGNNAAFGTSTLIFNNGTITNDAEGRWYGFPAGRRIANAVKFSGDINFNTTFNGQPSDLTFTGSVGLSNDAVGGSLRNITVNQPTYTQQNGSMVTFSGVISDGDSAYNSLSKLGTGTLRLTGTNTYTGITMVSAGNIAITSSANLGANPLVLMTGGTLSAWEQDFTLTKTLNFVNDNSNVDVAEGRTLTQGTLGWTGGSLKKIGSGTLVLTSPNPFGNVTITHGVLSVSDASQLGLGNINLNRDAGNNLYGNAGIPMLRITADTTVTQGILIAGTGGGAVSVDAGKTFTLTNGDWSSGTFYKLGDGTVKLAVNNPANALWDLHRGTLLVGNYTTGVLTPFGAGPNHNLAAGTLQLDATTADLTASMPATLNMHGGGTISLTTTGLFNSELTITSLVRVNEGTLVVSATNNLGATTNQRSRLVIPNVLGVGVASAITNGILPPVIVRTADGQLTGDADFLTGNNATNGLMTAIPTNPVTSISGLNPTAVAAITSTQTLSGANSVYALKTTANISGGALQILSNAGTIKFGGILLNGAGAAAPVISSDVFFGAVDNGVSALNGLFYGEGVVYAGGGYTSGTATLSGAVTANIFTKFGAGTLLLSGPNRILNRITVQSGTIQFGTGAAQPSSINIALNDAAQIDLNGGTVKIGALFGSASSGTAGVITNTSASAGTLVMVGFNNTTFTGNFFDGAGPVKIVKGGTANLTLSQFTIGVGGNVQANMNTQSGFVLRSGIITLNTPFALGSNSSTFEFQGGSLNLNTTGFGPGLATIIGSVGATSGGISVVVNGTSTAINTDNNGVFGSGFTDQYLQFGNLTLGNSTFGSTPSTDSQNLRFAGNISGGNAAIFNVLTGAGNSGRSVTDLSGVIRDTVSANAFAVTKAGSGNLRISGTTNTYTGGTNVLAGAIQVTATSGTPLGTGAVIVNPGAILRLADVSSVAGVSSVTVLSTPFNYGVIALDSNFAPTGGAFTSASMASAFGGTVQIAIPNYVGALDLSAIGDGKQFLGSYASQLGAGSNFLGSLAAGTGARYRVGAGGTLWFAGTDDVFSGSNLLEVGAPISLFTGGQTAPGNSTGTVFIANSNSYTGGTIINRGSTLQVTTGGAEAGATPLGTGVVEVLQGASLNYVGMLGTAVNPATGANANVIRLRQSATLLLDDSNGNLNYGFYTGAGNQGRWANTTGITLDGANFRLFGAYNLDSYEKMGAVTVGLGAGSVTVNRWLSGTAVLEVADILRGTDRGMLQVASSAYSFTGVLTQNSNVVTGIPSTANWYVGMPVIGINIPAGATVASITSLTSITLSTNVLAATPGTQTLFIPASALTPQSVSSDSASPPRRSPMRVPPLPAPALPPAWPRRGWSIRRIIPS